MNALDKILKKNTFDRTPLERAIVDHYKTWGRMATIGVAEEYAALHTENDELKKLLEEVESWHPGTMAYLRMMRATAPHTVSKGE